MVSAEVSPAGAAFAESLPCIVLVGMMGAGKTTVGRELAKRLGRRFVDSDHEIVERTGVPIPVIFDVEGEDGFRKRETMIIDELSHDSGVVLATGGGAVLRAVNRDILKSRCRVVYLDVPPQALFERTRHDKNRPLLQVENPRAKIESLYRERDPLYRLVAHVVVSGGRGSAKSMLRKIEKALQEQCAN